MTPAPSIADSESTPSREALASVDGSQPMLTILRVYNNGDRLPQRFPREQALDEIEYSIKWRFGCALFIGSECVQYGYLGPDRCAAISAELSSANYKLRCWNCLKQFNAMEADLQYKKGENTLTGVTHSDDPPLLQCPHCEAWDTEEEDEQHTIVRPGTRPDKKA